MLTDYCYKERSKNAWLFQQRLCCIVIQEEVYQFLSNINLSPSPVSYRHMVDDMLSADDVSCSSSQVSAKSEKNMADFDGEESGCEEELVQINSHAELTSHLQQHLPNLASIYHEHLSQGKG